MRQHRSDLLLKFEHLLAFTDKCRRLALLGHLEPGASGARLGLRRARWCCDNCTKHLLKGGKVGQSINIIISIINLATDNRKNSIQFNY